MNAIPSPIDPSTTADGQRALGMLVAREVIQRVNQAMEYFAKHSPDEYAEAFVAYDCEEAARESDWIPIEEATQPAMHLCGYDPETGTAKFLNTDKTADSFESDADSWEELCHAEDIEPYPIEILEYWAVTEWYAGKLREHGHVVSEILDFHVWGRSTSGQAILMDGVTERIARDMEILPGQRNDWSKK